MTSQQKMYRALVEKDSSFEGSFIACIKTTGIFCRPTCRARKPKKENVEFVRTTQEALRKGYRPCKICRPMEVMNATPKWLEELLRNIQKNPSLRVKDMDIRERGIDPNRVRRWFKKNHNMTFQAYLRSIRLGSAIGHLTEGGKVIDTAFNSGYESLSGFNSTFKKLTGVSPKKINQKNVINIYQLKTPMGPMIAGSVKEGICLLEFTDRRMLETEFIDLQKRLKAPILTHESKHIIKLKKELDEYFKGKRKKFTVPLFTPGTEFQNRVWDALIDIPYGETRSYKEQAIACGDVKAVRAVARANGANRIAIVIPCHRVIGSDGTLTGYAGGLDRKRRLLEIEGAL